MNGALLIVVGVLMLYLAITGKLNCVVAAFTACSLNKPAETQAMPTSATPKNNADILSTVFS